MTAFHKDGQRIHKPERAVFTNMVMIEDNSGRVLVQNRTNGWNGFVFPGGHLKEKETATSSSIREIYEETGLHISNLKLCGIKQWFHPEEGRNVCFLFKTNTFEGQLRSSKEGEVFWMALVDLLKSKDIASGFDKMLEVFLNNDINEMFYSDDGDCEPLLL